MFDVVNNWLKGFREFSQVPSKFTVNVKLFESEALLLL